MTVLGRERDRHSEDGFLEWLILHAYASDSEPPSEAAEAARPTAESDADPFSDTDADRGRQGARPSAGAGDS